MANRPFSVEEVVENPTHDQLHNICKVDWADVAKHYNIPITTSLRKMQLENVVVESLVDREILPEVGIKSLTPVGLQSDMVPQNEFLVNLRLKILQQQ